MTIKKLYPANESTRSVVGRIFPLKQMNRERREKIERIPPDLLKEIENFAARNAVLSVTDKNGGESYICCMGCLKAHALKKAKEMNLIKARKMIVEELRYEEGHNGYYLDKGKLVKI